MPLATGKRGSSNASPSCSSSPRVLICLWEEILKRDLEVQVMARPTYLRSNLIHGVRELPVQIH